MNESITLYHFKNGLPEGSILEICEVEGFFFVWLYQTKDIKNATFEKNIFDFIDAFECKNVEKSNPVDINAT